MTTILKIDASVRGTDNPRPDYNSISRALSDSFVTSWRQFDADVNVIERNVGQNPPAFINNDFIAAAFTPEDQLTEAQKELLSLSDTLIDELDRSDIILMSTPMYNYGMPAALKAWFDQVIRIHKTFTFDLARGDYPLEPIMSGKTLVLLVSSGEFGFHPGGMRESWNHLGPHIKTASRYLGVDSMHEVWSEYQEFGDERFEQSNAKAHKNAAELALKLAKESLASTAAE